ncbi:retrotransposon protein, putative, ty3-gypsy subclass [Tanacetum coccineum]
MESSTSSQPNHPYSPVNRINFDMDFEENMFSQDYNYNQDYSMGYASGHARAKKDAPKDLPKDWTVAEETALCQAWCDVSENIIPGNNMKTSGFWDAVITYFEKETGSTRANHESGTRTSMVYQKRLLVWNYKMIYKQDFTLEHCYNVLKDHQGWIQIEMPNFYTTQRRKKSKTSETTSGSASGGIDLNDEADEETEELRPMGRDDKG